MMEYPMPPSPDEIEQRKKLTAENVNDMMKVCLYKSPDGQKPAPENLPEDSILIEGVIYSYLFSRDKIEQFAGMIDPWLDQLHPNFHADTGGWSFLNACETRDGVLWGEHVDAERLMCLGIAAGRVEISLPRDLWPSLPGEMPYFVVKAKE